MAWWDKVRAAQEKMAITSALMLIQKLGLDGRKFKFQFLTDRHLLREKSDQVALAVYFEDDGNFGPCFVFEFWKGFAIWVMPVSETIFEKFDDIIANCKASNLSFVEVSTKITAEELADVDEDTEDELDLGAFPLPTREVRIVEAERILEAFSDGELTQGDATTLLLEVARLTFAEKLNSFDDGEITFAELKASLIPRCAM